MEVMFTPFTLCNFNSYEITLLVNETTSEDTCNITEYAETRKHSSKTVYVEICKPGGMCISKDPCDEVSRNKMQDSTRHIIINCFCVFILI